MKSFTSIFQGFYWNYDLSFFFCLLLGTPVSRNISYFVAVSESIVSNILIMKKVLHSLVLLENMLLLFIFGFQPKKCFSFEKVQHLLWNSSLHFRFIPPHNFLKFLTPHLFQNLLTSPQKTGRGRYLLWLELTTL